MSFFYLEKNVSAKHVFVNRKFNMGDNNKVYDLQHRWVEWNTSRNISHKKLTKFSQTVSIFYEIIYLLKIVFNLNTIL